MNYFQAFEAMEKALNTAPNFRIPSADPRFGGSYKLLAAIGRMKSGMNLQELLQEIADAEMDAARIPEDFADARAAGDTRYGTQAKAAKAFHEKCAELYDMLDGQEEGPDYIEPV